MALNMLLWLCGSMVKWLRHRPFTAVTGVQIPLESLRMRQGRCPVFNRINMDLWVTQIPDAIPFADVAQLAEQLICNQQVIGSSPIIGFFGPLAQLVRATGS